VAIAGRAPRRGGLAGAPIHPVPPRLPAIPEPRTPVPVHAIPRGAIHVQEQLSGPVTPPETPTPTPEPVPAPDAVVTETRTVE